MPDAAAYAEGFGIHEGLKIAGYKLVNYEIQHKQVQRWNEYAYPTLLQWKWDEKSKPTQSDYDSLSAEFSKYAGGTRIIYSEHGRPYKCKFHYLSSAPIAAISEDFRRVDLEYEGFAKRIGQKEAASIESGNSDW